MKKRFLQSETMRKNVPEEKLKQYITTLKKMIDCKTVYDKEGTNKEEFQRFYKILEQEFPNIHKKAKRLTFGNGCFVYVIEGKNSVENNTETNGNKNQVKKESKNHKNVNIMLMSHHDVVEGDENWETDPFCAVEKENALWGRGTIDTKTPLFAQLQACEELLSEGYEFEGRNLYIGSSNNEECCGNGMVLATQYFEEKGIRFEVVLDEGGAITTGQIPSVSEKSAMVAVHEKSRHVYRCKTKLTANGHGGFGPAGDNALIRMSNFISEVSKKKIYKGNFYPEVKATFASHAPYMSFPMNLLFGNFSIFGPVIKKIMLKIPQTNPMLSTSISFTAMTAGKNEEPQLRAKEAEATMFLRCIREEDLLEGLKKIKEIGKKYGVEIEEVFRDYCEPTDYNGTYFKLLEDVLHENFPDVIVAPFLLTAGTDARHFTKIADSILRFAPIDLDKKQFASIHNANEHIKVKNVGECVCFYKDFVQRGIG